MPSSSSKPTKTQSGRQSTTPVKDADDSWFDVSEGLDKLIQPIKEWQITNAIPDSKNWWLKLSSSFAFPSFRICVYLISSSSKNLGLHPYYSRTYCGWNGTGSQDLKIPCTAGFPSSSTSTFTPLWPIPSSTSVSNSLLLAIKWKLQRYDTLLTNGTITNLDALMVYVSNSGMIYNRLFTCVAYIVTGIGVLMTPTIADTIVTAGGAGAMTKMKSAAGKWRVLPKQRY